MNFSATSDFAQQLDAQDTLRDSRQQFYFPQQEGSDVIYLCGNSLGLQPKGVEKALLHELEHWRKYGVEGHFEGELPWMYYHRFLQAQSASIVGGKTEEVVVMNTLTTNLHLLMVSFYRPTKTRYKIIMEAGAFPSDQYAVESQVRYHGLDPEAAIIEVTPRTGETLLRTEDILETITQHGDSTALVLFGGVNYFTGQYYDLEAITVAGHEAGVYVGFDLAHAAGNVELRLHDWQVDFAVWCSYKYLNSGPGGPGGIFVHEQYANRPDLPRFAGWWGHDEKSRFLMRKGFKPMQGAAGWQLSNAQIFSFAAHKVSLDLFAEVGLTTLRQKSERLTGYMEFLLNQLDPDNKLFQILTPSDPKQRGCQLSIYAWKDGKQLFDFLSKKGAIVDWREDNLLGNGGGIIRVAPVPLYNSFSDVYTFVELLKQAVNTER
ncbi:MAG: kynureninase [Saprospiraceae bacterium]|nr:MAG: kynureninase [Saprospiraceae bacterium]